jgi:transposase
MARTGRPPKALLTVSDEEREILNRYIRRGRASRSLAFRARIILGLTSSSGSAVARSLRTTSTTVCKWRNRFIEKRIGGLLDEPRPGAERTVTDDQVEAVVVKTLESTPVGRTHWSTRSMAKSIGLSHTTIGRIWRTFGLKPHVSTDFRLSDDPLLIEKVRDIVGLYMSPPDNAVVVCVDEKSQIQALSRATPILPMDLGQPEQRTHNYRRHGTTDLFAALHIKTGKVTSKLFGRHRAKEFIKFLGTIDDDVPAELDVHVVLDNLSTHKTPAVHRWLVGHPRFHLHFTPTHASWLNMVERFFGLLTEHALRRGSHNSVKELRTAIVAYIDSHNAEPKPFRWTKSADEILEKLARFAGRTLMAHPS